MALLLLRNQHKIKAGSLEKVKTLNAQGANLKTQDWFLNLVVQLVKLYTNATIA
jgi:hypothetical protein